MTMEPVCQYNLHKAIFENSYSKFKQLLHPCHSDDLNLKDVHGNTPLNLAVMLGKEDFIRLLLTRHASVNSRNLNGWNAVNEAISYGQLLIVEDIISSSRHQMLHHMKKRVPQLRDVLNSMDDFCMEIKWEFTSWVPFLSRVLPSDVFKISKKGSVLRLDSSLVEFREFTWSRGDITMLFDGNAEVQKALTILDNATGNFTYYIEQFQKQISRGIMVRRDQIIFMNSDNVSVRLHTKDVSFSKVRSGWLFRSDKCEKIGDYDAELYIMDGASIEIRKRKEHFASAKDEKKQKKYLDEWRKGNISTEEMKSVPSTKLDPPAPPTITWEEYIEASPGSHPTLGRELLVKCITKRFQAAVAMSEDFPLKINELLDILEVIASYKHVQRLREVLKTAMPPGFPVKIEVPVFPTVTAKVMFDNFKWADDLDQQDFIIPPNYKHSDTHFRNFFDMDD